MVHRGRRRAPAPTRREAGRPTAGAGGRPSPCTQRRRGDASPHTPGRPRRVGRAVTAAPAPRGRRKTAKRRAPSAGRSAAQRRRHRQRRGPPRGRPSRRRGGAGGRLRTGCAPGGAPRGGARVSQPHRGTHAPRRRRRATGGRRRRRRGGGAGAPTAAAGRGRQRSPEVGRRRNRRPRRTEGDGFARGAPHERPTAATRCGGGGAARAAASSRRRRRHGGACGPAAARRGPPGAAGQAGRGFPAGGGDSSAVCRGRVDALAAGHAGRQNRHGGGLMGGRRAAAGAPGAVPRVWRAQATVFALGASASAAA